MTVRRVRNKSVHRKINIALDSIGSAVLKVGWVARKQYPDSEMTTGQVAAIAESGYPKKNIPPRPIIRPTIIREEKTWKQIVKHESKKILKGSQSAVGALNVLGNIASGEMRKTITQLHSPPIKRATALARTRTYAETIKIPRGDPNAKSLRIKRKAQIAEQLSKETVWKPLVATKILLNSLTFSVEKE